MKLSIVIPALNEEGAIGDTISRCLEARAHIWASGDVDEVELLVVSDGSTDRTEAIASGFPQVTVLAFVRNRGYGAAIQCGFAHASGDLLGFLDADGTCDPRAFADLCHALVTTPADVALGSRMGADSEMPWVRSLGNWIFAWILGVLARSSVRDTASGMRVLRRTALVDLVPLPDGLHFTPAMSARILLEGKLRLVEVPMPYAERVGSSKLSLLVDGGRFLRCILQAATAYRPARPLLLIAAALTVAALGLGAGPTLLWLRQRHVEEWMIHRVMAASLLAMTSALVVCAAVLGERIAELAHGRAAPLQGVTAVLVRLFRPRTRFWAGVVLLGAAFFLVAPGLVESVEGAPVTIHWSRIVLASLLVVLFVALGTTTFLLRMLELILVQRAPASAAAPPDRLRPGRAG